MRCGLGPVGYDLIVPDHFGNSGITEDRRALWSRPTVWAPRVRGEMKAVLSNLVSSRQPLFANVVPVPPFPAAGEIRYAREPAPEHAIHGDRNQICNEACEPEELHRRK